MSLLALVLVVTRLLFFLLVCSYFFIVGALISLINFLNPNLKSSILVKHVSGCAKILLFVFNIKTDIYNHEPANLQENYLIVANHLSYIDVIVLAAMKPTFFVTSMEMKKTFFLGHICQMAGCVFVDRKNKQNINGEVGEMTNELFHGNTVLFFPEATSTDGEKVLPFKASLFEASVKTNVPILPISIRYDNDDICWYGEMSFVPHFLSVLGIFEINVNLNILDPIDPGNLSKFELAQKSHFMIERAYRSTYINKITEAKKTIQPL